MAVEWLRISGGGRDASVVATASAASAAVLLLEIACRLILLVVSDVLSIPLRRIPKRRVPREMPQVSENLYHSHPRNIPLCTPFLRRDATTFPSLPPPSPFAATRRPSYQSISFSLCPPFSLFFLLSLLRVYLIFLSGHGIFPSSFFSFARLPRFPFRECSSGLLSRLLRRSRRQHRTYTYLYVHVCARALCSSHET